MWQSCESTGTDLHAGAFKNTRTVGRLYDDKWVVVQKPIRTGIAVVYSRARHTGPLQTFAELQRIFDALVAFETPDGHREYVAHRWKEDALRAREKKGLAQDWLCRPSLR